MVYECLNDIIKTQLLSSLSILEFQYAISFCKDNVVVFVPRTHIQSTEEAEEQRKHVISSCMSLFLPKALRRLVLLVQWPLLY
jgi:hypothetical protein